MKTIWIVNYEGDYGEAQAFYDDENELVHYWWSNDGNWRNEYFNPAFEKLGILIKSSYRERPELVNKFEEFLKENY